MQSLKSRNTSDLSLNGAEMAMTLRPQTFTTIDTDFLQSSVSCFNAVSCGLFSTGSIKTEPMGVDDNADSVFLQPSPLASSCSSRSPQYGSSETTYTELKQAKFLQLKQGQPSMMSSCDSSLSQPFDSWCYKHPQHWNSSEVLDCVFHLFESDGLDGSLFCGEVYNTLSGKQLCSMSLDEFIALDPHYGARVHEVLRYLLHGANFKTPELPIEVKTESLGNVPNFTFLETPSERQPASRSPATSETNLSVILDEKQKVVKVNLTGLGCYDIDDFDFDDDNGYQSNSDTRSDELERMLSDEEESSEQSPLGRTPLSSSSSDSGCESDDKRPPARRRQPSSTKGNHLWEFVKDLLKDSRFNPSLLKWEDKEMGVFKFVQSEAVAAMWGRKKNNPGMTYEKLSRAMRFCRSAGYFDSVPKNGRFPKKLCFRFGPKAHGWKE